VSKDPRIVAALSLCRKLQANGWAAYWVGGAVRDLLMNTKHVPSDIDIATDAPYDEICRILPDTRAIGKAFGVGLASTGDHSFEVATFRKESDYADRRHPSQVGPGTIEEDSERRDFTVNALYFDPVSGMIIDFHDGVADLNDKIIRSNFLKEFELGLLLERKWPVLKVLHFVVLQRVIVGGANKSEHCARP